MPLRRASSDTDPGESNGETGPHVVPRCITSKGGIYLRRVRELKFLAGRKKSYEYSNLKFCSLSKWTSSCAGSCALSFLSHARRRCGRHASTPLQSVLYCSLHSRLWLPQEAGDLYFALRRLVRSSHLPFPSFTETMSLNTGQWILRHLSFPLGWQKRVTWIASSQLCPLPHFSQSLGPCCTCSPAALQPTPSASSFLQAPSTAVTSLLQTATSA